MMSCVTDECPCEITVEYLPVILDVDGTPGRAIIDPSWIRVSLDKGGITKLKTWFVDRDLSANLYGPYFRTFMLKDVSYPSPDNKNAWISGVRLNWIVQWYVEIPDSRTYLRYCLEVEQLDTSEVLSWTTVWKLEWKPQPESVNSYLREDAIEMVRRHSGGLPGDRHRIRTKPTLDELFQEQHANEKAPQ
ncbi:MAG: hypothetical protein IKE60_26290 [Reyranella sp.]|uniref:hypothetical protein n=1 Tax=Reyranella sp. TaxID=1929291 RepID=UPI0025D68B3E|nr:hypothetical protein [Reyranella sp.]MBR2818199.1 hypothetical protein [Reyranella sp.]